MALTEQAKKMHDKLFPGGTTSLSDTDPDLIDIFDNFAFDEVQHYGNLDDKTRQMVILATLIAQHTVCEYTAMLDAALTVGVTPVEIKEILYHAVPYCGIAKVVDALHATNKVFQTRGIALPLKSQSTTTREDRFEKGLAVQKSIFGGEHIDKFYQTAPKDQQHIVRYLSDNCFGDFYTRTGLDVKMRELITFAVIMSLGGCESQLKSHVQGNLNVGNNREALLSAATQILPYIGYPRTLNAIACINAVIPPK